MNHMNQNLATNVALTELWQLFPVNALVGSFVWSHLFNIQKTEDPLKKELMELLPHDIISKDFEAEPWKYSSHMDYTMDAGIL